MGALPPLFGVAVNVIELPEQIDVEVAVMETEGVTELTVKVPLPVEGHPARV